MKLKLMFYSTTSKDLKDSFEVFVCKQESLLQPRRLRILDHLYLWESRYSVSLKKTIKISYLCQNELLLWLVANHQAGGFSMLAS